MKHLVTALIAAMLVTTLGCSINVGMRKTKNLEEVVLSQKDGEDKILLLPIEGMISLRPQGNFFSKEPSVVASIREQLDHARRDKKVKGVILRINSRGGSLGATQMIYDEIMGFRKDTGA